MNATLVVTAFLLGLAGSGHCVAMCGPASGALLRGGAPGTLLRFHAGRVLGYGLMGGAVALLGLQLQAMAAFAGLLRPLWAMTNAAAFVVGAALLVTGRQPALLENAGQRLTTLLRRLPDALVPARALALQSTGGVSLSPADIGGRAARPQARTRGAALGVCWALMPCGLLHSALLLAALSGAPVSGAAALAAFALASALPLVFAQRLMTRGLPALARWERLGNRLLGAAICAVSVLGIWWVLAHEGEGLFCLPG